MIDELMALTMLAIAVASPEAAEPAAVLFVTAASPVLASSCRVLWMVASFDEFMATLSCGFVFCWPSGGVSRKSPKMLPSIF